MHVDTRAQIHTNLYDRQLHPECIPRLALSLISLCGESIAQMTKHGKVGLRRSVDGVQ